MDGEAVVVRVWLKVVKQRQEVRSSISVSTLNDRSYAVPSFADLLAILQEVEVTDAVLG